MTDKPERHLASVANIFSMMMKFKKAGDIHEGHSHSFDHLTLLATGKMKVVVDRKEKTFTAPHHIYIKAGVVHELTALEDNTIAFCIHVLRDGDDIVTPDMVPSGVKLNQLYEQLTKD